MLYAIYIVNKSGGLIFRQDTHSAMPRLNGNDYLRLASNFYSMWTIARQIAPVASSGIKVLEADGFKLHSFVSPTGTFFFVITDPATYNADPELARLYELYADYVLKNPFYEIEQPINCSQFDAQLELFVAQTNRSSLAAPFA